MSAPFHHDAIGIEVTFPPSENGVAPHTKRFTHAEVSALTNYDALNLGLPLTMEAVMVLRIEGRIDMPNFSIRHSIEPFNHMHPWTVYRREGALLFVGERVMRLNPYQLKVFNALDAMHAAGTDVAERLRVWSKLVESIDVGRKSHVIVEGELPYLRLVMTEQFPASAMTRRDGLLTPASHAQGATWAMESGRKYYIR
jgi:hypothetical protein